MTLDCLPCLPRYRIARGIFPPSKTCRAWLGALSLTLSACAPLHTSPGNGAIWRPSPNYDARRPNFVILHHTTNTHAAKALQTLTDPRRQVSAHYLIGRDGIKYQLVDEASRAWHAGDSWWGGSSDLNSASIGIELDNTGDEDFAEPQIVALLGLLEEVRERHRIPAENILGHGDIAPMRKVDPSQRFPWARLAERGFGLWCDNAEIVPAREGLDSILAWFLPSDEARGCCSGGAASAGAKSWRANDF